LQAANAYAESLRTVTSSVHEQTSRIVEEQMGHVDKELHVLDDIVERIEKQNNGHHEAHEKSLKQLASTVQSSYLSIEDTFATSFSRVETLGSEISARTETIQNALPDLDADGQVRKPLGELRSQMEADSLEEYITTGLTPMRRDYNFPKTLPRTNDRDNLLAKLRGEEPSGDEAIPALEGIAGQRSPSKGLVFTDMPDATRTARLNTRPGTANSTSSLRELDPNMSNPVASVTDKFGKPFVASKTVPTSSDSENAPLPPLKKHQTTGAAESRASKKRGPRKTVAGNALSDRENVTMPVNLSASVGVGTRHPVGRRLRSHERN
jgi:kinesin family protein 11